MFDPPRTPAGEALALVELTSIARAFVVADAMMKRAPSTLWFAGPMSQGRFLIALTGGLAEVDESYRAGLALGGGFLLDHVLLPQVDRQIVTFISGKAHLPEVGALGIVETNTVSATIRGADAALKATEARLVHLMMGRGIDGKGVFAFTGELHDVQASLLESLYACGESRVVNTEEIAAPHGAMTLRMLGLGSQGPYY